jgi:hypothetical protein
MTDPARAEWLWLAIAVAMLWTVAVGCAAEHAAEQASRCLQMPQTAAGATRELRCFRRGRVMLVTTLCLGQNLPATQLVPEPWPKTLDTKFIRHKLFTTGKKYVRMYDEQVVHSR